MPNVLITAQFIGTTSFSVATTGGGGASSAFTAGTRYPTVQDVIDKLNTDLAAHVTFAWDSTTGDITVAWDVSPNTLTWNSAELQAYLGFDDAVISQVDTSNDEPPKGWWYGAVATPWGAGRRYNMDDVASDFGRTTAHESSGVLEEGTIRLWLHRRQDADFAGTMEDAYAVADEWAAYPLTLTDAQGNERQMVVADGWEFAPQLLDEDTVYLDMEAQSWQPA
jgi:hypothetical protein